MSSLPPIDVRPRSDVGPRSLESAALPAKWVSRRGALRRLSKPAIVDAAIAAIAVVFVASPLIFTSNGFAPDFTSDLWMASVQQHMIAAHLHPTLFLNTQQQGIFQPQFAFYGGTLFTITGAVAVLLGGSTILAFDLVTLAAIAGAYGGLFWIARQLGVRGRLAHAPALVFVTSAYYVTDLYGRGAWAEFTAVSVLVLLLAASLRLLRGPLSVGPVCCLLAASIVFSGSHNITLLLSSTIAALALAAYWLLSGRSRELPWRRIVAVLGLIALGVCVNAWFLLPDVSYAQKTLISTENITWAATGFFNSFGVIFDPLRTVPSASETPGLFVQVPDLALLWGLLMLPLIWRERRLRAGAVTALIALVALFTVIMSETVYGDLPELFRRIQFPYRFQTYVVLSCATLVLLGVLTLTRRAAAGRATRLDRGLALGLGLALTLGVAICAWQLWVPETRIYGGYYESFTDRAEALRDPPTILPKSWYAPNNFGDDSLPIVAARHSAQIVPTSVHDERVSGLASLPAGPIATNIAGGPYLVHVGGDLRVVGRTSTGYLVLERTRTSSRPLPFEVKTQLSAPVLLGRVITILAMIAIAVLALIAAARSLRRRMANRAVT